MSEFVFTVLTGEGRRASGRLLAPTREDALRMLSEQNFVVTDLNTMMSLGERIGERLGLHRANMSGDQLLAFTTQLAAMIDAGMGIKNSLDCMRADMRSRASRALLSQVSSALNEGRSLAEALEKYPHVFSSQYLTLVRAGEASGRLPAALRRLAGLLESERAMWKKIQSSLYYPCVVLVFTAMILSGLFYFAVPRFEAIYQGLGGELPLATRIFLELSHFLRDHLYFIVVMLGTAISVVRWLASTPAGRLAIDRALLVAPISGPLCTRIAISRFAHTLGTLISSGVPFLQALELVSESIPNRVLRRRVRTAMREIMRGSGIAETLRGAGVFTEMAISMIASGEQCGTLEEMLKSVADFYDTEIDAMLKGLSSMIEPIIMMAVGTAVGVTVLVMVLPIFKMATLLIEH